MKKEIKYKFVEKISKKNLMTKSNIKKLFFCIYMLWGKCNLVEENDKTFVKNLKRKVWKNYVIYPNQLDRVLANWRDWP